MQSFDLNYSRSDIEERWLMVSKKYTAVNNVFAFFLGLLFTIAFYGCMFPFYTMHKWQMVDMFFHGGSNNRSVIPYFTMFLTFWCIAFLFIKWRKLALQRKALLLTIIPDTPDFLITRMNARNIIAQIHAHVYQSERFMVLWRIECALSNLDNFGKVSEVSSVLNDLAENDSNYVESTYTFPKGLIWAIPVLGFIGTVLGLSQAVGDFGSVVASGADLERLKSSLSGVTSGLATAFETTLIALVAALIVQLLMTMLSHKEEEFLDSTTAFCYRNVTSKLRMIDMNEIINSIPVPEKTVNVDEAQSLKQVMEPEEPTLAERLKKTEQDTNPSDASLIPDATPTRDL